MAINVKFQFIQQSYDKLTELANKREGGNRAQAVNKALSLYAFCLEKMKEGYEIQMVKDGTTNKIDVNAIGLK